MAGTRCDKSRYWSTVLGGGGSPDPARPRIDFASSPATAASSVSSPASGASTPPYADIATAEVLTSLRYSASSDVLPSGPAAGRVGKPFSCGEPGCSSRFSHISSKYRHFRTVHLGRRDHHCKVEGCGLSFGERSGLKKHTESVHSKIRKYACSWEGCHLRFSFALHLAQHRSTVHLKERPFRCNWQDCEARFGQKSSLTRHIRQIHTRARQ